MKKVKKLIAAAVVAGVLGSAGIAYAAAVKTPAEIVSDLTGKTTETLYQERSAGKTYGTIAKEAGKLDEFKTQMLEQKKAVLDQRVQDGQLTQTQADEVYNTIKDNQVECDGTGNAAIGKKYGAVFGQGNGMGMHQGYGRGAGMGHGYGRGAGRGIASN